MNALLLFASGAPLRIGGASRPAVGTLRAAAHMTLDLRAVRAARFPHTVDVAAQLLGARKPSPPTSAPLLAALLRTPDGARGALVAALSDPALPHCDEPLDAQFAALVGALARRGGGDDDDDAAAAHRLRKLLVTNVVMPSAMAVSYAQRGEPQLLHGSRLTARRASSLLRVVADDHMVQHVARQFVRGLERDDGPFGHFATKWGYSQQQRRQAVNAIAAAVPHMQS